MVAYLLLFFALTDAGLLGPDEPRYASIGREMASSGDWITPRLWGDPWFEKPALLYWMTGLGFRAGLGEEAAPRLPIALASLAFLVLFQRLLEREFGRRPAWYATIALATSAGWVAFSHVGVTDLPMTAAFAAAMLLCLPWIAAGNRKALLPAGGLLGLAVLAKGLVPLIFALPLLWAGRKRLRDLLMLFAATVLTAAPWYLLCTFKNGAPFLEDFFWKHHFQRFSSEALQHVQPFWFYVPVLLAGIVPWTPLAAGLFNRRLYNDPRVRFLLIWFGFGFVFLSVSTNKLPGYLLPLLPALCALLGLALAEAKNARWMLVGVAVLLAFIPIAAVVMPEALRVGISRASFPAFPWITLAPLLLVAALTWWFERAGKRDHAMGVLLVAAVAGVVYLKAATLPVLDQTVSTRDLWRQISSRRDQVCVEQIHRSWRYGLNYYSVEPLPACEVEQKPLHVRQRPGEPAYLSH